VQSHSAIVTLVLVMGVGTWVMLALGSLVSLRFRLNRGTHDVLMAEIEHLRSGARTPSSAPSQAIVEDLSGWDYDRLWGNNPVGRAS